MRVDGNFGDEMRGIRHDRGRFRQLGRGDYVSWTRLSSVMIEHPEDTAMHSYYAKKQMKNKGGVRLWMINRNQKHILISIQKPS